MLPFAFDRTYHSQQYTTLHQQELLSRILMLTLENQRLSALNSHLQNQSQSFTFSPQLQNHAQMKVELELKRLEIDNLTLALQELHKKVAYQQSKLREQEQSLTFHNNTSRQELNELKTQLNNYKSKYEEQLSNRNKFHKQEQQFQKIIKELQQHQEQRKQMLKNMVSNKDRMLQESERNNKQSKREIAKLIEEIGRKEEECVNLRDALKDAPKIEELNRWIAKVKEYEEKQLTACARISQMGQDLCSAKQKYRKLEHEHKQLQKIKNQLEQAVTTNKDNEDSMTIYFDRLTTYENTIHDLEQEVRALQRKNEELENGNHRYVYMLCSKYKQLEQEKQQAVRQWQLMSDEMSKQRSLLHAMQEELDHYNKLNRQNMKNNSARVESHSHLGMVQSHIIDKLDKKQPSQLVSRLDTLNSNYPSRESTRRELRQNRLDSSKNERVVFHSDRVSHTTERMQTHSSVDNSLVRDKEPGCPDCTNRGKVSRSNSTGNNPFTFNLRNPPQQQPTKLASSSLINDEKRMLLDKLNYLHPQQDSFRLPEKQISSLYSKSYRNLAPTTSILKHNMKPNSQSKLSIAKTKLNENKENMQESFARRYMHGFERRN